MCLMKIVKLDVLLIGPYGDIGFIHKMEDLLEENSRGVSLADVYRRKQVK